MKLLIVEDEDAIAEPLVEGLRREGFEVERVATGAAALEAPEPDLVLLDVGLPDTDGFSVARELRSRSAVPIIIVTAKGEEIDRVVGLEPARTTTSSSLSGSASCSRASVPSRAGRTSGRRRAACTSGRSSSTCAAAAPAWTVASST